MAGGGGGLEMSMRGQIVAAIILMIFLIVVARFAHFLP